MSMLTANGIRQHYRLEGPEQAPVVMLAHSLGTELSLWDRVAAILARRLRVLRYDCRGHGASEAPAGPYEMAQFGADVLALLDALGIARVHFCGLSMGGLIGQWLALHAPGRIERLVLANTAAKIGETALWQRRAAQVLEAGMAEVVAGTAARWFSPAFLAADAAEVARLVGQIERADPQGYAASCMAIATADFRERLGELRATTLCIAGGVDPVTTSAEADALAQAIPDARRLDLNAAHLSAVEAPAAFGAALTVFLQERRERRHEDQRYAEGLAMRRAVLGDAHVERSLRERTEHTEAFQDLITRYAWGEIWTRPGLPRHTRSLLTIAMMVALNREAELRLHLHAARNNGVTRAEILEVLLQTAIYCGVPAANSAIHLAEEVFAEFQ